MQQSAAQLSSRSSRLSSELMRGTQPQDEAQRRSAFDELKALLGRKISGGGGGGGAKQEGLDSGGNVFFGALGASLRPNGAAKLGPVVLPH
jgi:hypothetical protein